MLNNNEVQCNHCATRAKAGTKECPICGYRPKMQLKITGVVFVLGGLIFTATIIGAILGIPILIYGVYLLRRADKVDISYSTRRSHTKHYQH